jgi:uncharacterized membrane protein YphA (DoxX/SURF4 family)
VPETREVEMHETAERGPEVWSIGKLLVFRVVFCYVALYSVDVIVFTLETLTGPRNVGFRTPWLTGYVWVWLVPWVGQHLLHLKSPVALVNIGADVPFEFILRGTELAIAVVCGVMWSALDRKRQEYWTLYAWLRLGARLALAGVMLRYGIGKLIPLQFGPLTLHRLSRPLGELSPMGMLWAFMAASKGYTILSGAVEVMGGVLLLFPELTGLGALLSAGAMANVFVLNVFYDVNQKTRSLNYLVLALFLLAPFVGRLLDVLVWNRRSQPVARPEISRRRWVRLAVWWLPLAYGVVLVSAMLPPALRAYTAQRRAQSVRDANFGVWEATSFTVADPAKPLLTAEMIAGLEPDAGQYRWKRLILDSDHKAGFQFSSGEWYVERYKTQANAGGSGTRTILSTPDDSSWKCILLLVPMPGNQLQMSGTVNGNEVHAVFHREDIEGTYHLTDPPRWISDGQRDY